MDFDETVKANLNDKEMSEALLQIQTDIRPNTQQQKRNKLYKIDEMTGEKKRISDKEKSKRK